MAAPMFDDDLFDFGHEAEYDDTFERGSAESAGQDDSALTGAGAADDVPSQGSGRRRKRGVCGGTGSSATEHKWRSGAVPQAPEFDGDVERDPYCLRHYRRRLLRWVKITKEFLPPNEQALRALEKLTGEAELEFEEVSDDRFDHPDGVSRLLGDLEKAFGEREIFRQGGVIREFESIGRMQGESITAFIRRFRLLERKLSENKVPEYPEQARVIKLLDGLRLDEKATASILLAAGNRYEMKSVLEALRIQYPPGMSITGLPKGLSSLSSRSTTTRSSTSRVSTYKSSATHGNRRNPRSQSSGRWTQWHTEWDGEDETVDQGGDYEPEEENQGEDFEYEPNHEEEGNEDDDEELIREEAGDSQPTEEVPEDMSALLAAAEALTVTSKKLAGLVQSRGFYVQGKGKGKSPGKSGGKKGGKSKGKGSPSGKGHPKGKASGKKGKPGGAGGAAGADRQNRLKGSLCLGCGASDHWIRDCPHVTRQTWNWTLKVLQTSWMVSSQPAPTEQNVRVFRVPRPPSIMLSTCEDASYMIADTGCQRQVAGSVWHQQKCSEILPLVPLRFEEVCRFSFGPTSGMPSKGRFLYPAGIAGEAVMLGISEVEAPAPGLLSRRTMEALGAVPDLLEGTVYFKAFGKSTDLFLSPCGHLAIKIDEWPNHAFDWPGKYSTMQFSGQGPPDVLHDKAFPPSREFIYTTQMAVLYYSAATLRPKLKDMVLKMYMEPCSAVTMMGTQAAMAASSALQLNHYRKSPAKCDHTSGTGTRTYAAGGQRIRICDSCGSRWVLTLSGEALEAVPKANPSAKTPLGLTDAQKKKLAKAKGKPKDQSEDKGGASDGSWQRLSASSREPSQAKAGHLGLTPPPPPRPSWGPQTQSPSLFRMNGQRMPPRQWHSGRSAASSDTDMSVETTGQGRQSRQPRLFQRREEENPNEEEGPGGLTAQEVDEILMSQANDVNLWEERMGRDDWDVDARDEMPSEMRRQFEERGSADAPLCCEDFGCFVLKAGVRKRLSGSAKLVLQAWETEAQVYANRVQSARKLREYRADLIEIDCVSEDLSEKALEVGLRVLEPVQVTSASPVSVNPRTLKKLVGRHRPFLVVWRVNARPRSKSEEGRIRQVCLLLHELLSDGVHFLLRACEDEVFLSGLELRQLQAAPGVRLQNRDGVTYMTNLPELLATIFANQVEAQPLKEEIQLIKALQDVLHQRGDERWNQNWQVFSGLPGDDEAWVCDVHHDDPWENFDLLWEPPGEPQTSSVFFLDISRQEESWKPLLQEAEQRLKNLATNGVTLKPSPYLERVKALVPWKLQRVQIFRAPKQRRLPAEVSQEGTQHRGAALMHNDDTIVFEAEKISSIIQAPTGKFTKPVRIAIFFYGDAPATSMNDQENELPEQPKNRPEPREGEPHEKMHVHQPGYRDITFPGVDIPSWMQQVLRRLHCNLGHPPKETLVRHLAIAKASEAALKGARHLRCEVCLRVSPPHQPRVSKAFQARRFNDRMSMDIIYLKDIRGGTHMFLNCVDDATCYQAASRLLSRSEENVVSNLVNGWFCFFGPPDELTIDAEGAFRGMRFESLHAQLNVDVRCIPPDSHWQLGKAERHGQALRYNASRLINQFAALTVAEVNVCVASAVQAKNRLMRRSGSSPNQWVFGKDPKLPGALLSDGGSIESAQLTSDSERLMQIESIRVQAMNNHHEFEANQALRSALLRKSRPYRGEFYPGQKIAYFRKRTAAGDGEGTVEGYRQGIVVSLDRNPNSNVAANLWIRNSRGRLVQASPEQCRPVFGEEWWSPDPADLEVLRKFDKDVQLHPRAFRHSDHPGPADDRQIAEAIDAQLPPQLSEPSQDEPLQPQAGTPVVPEDDTEQAPRPTPLTLDPAGRPVLENSEDTREIEDEGDFQRAVSGSDLTNLPGVEPMSKIVETVFANYLQHPIPQRVLRLFLLSRSLHFSFIVKDAVNSTAIFLADAVKEREAFDKLLGVTRDHVEPAPSLKDPQVQDVIDDYQSHVPGIYVHEAFLTAAYVFGNADQEEGVFAPHAEPHTTSIASETTTSNYPTTSKPPPLSESLAALLLKREDFSHDSCHQLLQTATYKPVDRQCLSASSGNAGSLTLGYFSHGRQHGFTKATDNNRALLKYVNAYLKHHGLQGKTSSVFIGRNIRSRYHKDVHNSKGAANWSIALGNHVGGHLWVEAEYDSANSGEIVRRSVKGKKVYGKFHDNYQKLVQFDPDNYHGTEEYVGERFVITAYQTRLADLASEDSLKKMRKLGFKQGGKHVTFTTATTADFTPDLPKEIRPLWEVFPVKEQSSAGQEAEKVIAMESSSDEEGCDGSSGFGARRAAQQARKKEVHWQSMTEDEIEPFVEALRKEWSEWQKWASCSPVHVKEGAIAPHLVLRSRVCYRWKPAASGFKAKARVVVAGFRDPHLPLLTRDAPVLARASLHLLLQWAATFRVKLWNADAKSAFLQGDPDSERPEPIFMKPPGDPLALQAVPEWRVKTLLYKLSAPVYGQSNAPRQWYNHFSRVLRELSWESHSLDPCLFLYRHDNKVVALLGLHVDDLLSCALPGYEEVLNRVESKFTWGSPWTSGDFTFVGRHIKQWPDGSITVDQASYVEEVPATRVKLDDAELLSQHPELVTEFRSGIGSLQWLASTSRGDIASDVSLLQKPPTQLTVADLKEVNAVLRYVRATASACIKITPIDVDQLIFVAYGDSGFANAPGNKSQGGLVIVATDRVAKNQETSASLLEWKSYRHQRVLRSTLAAEAAALDRTHDHAHFLAMTFSEMCDATFISTLNDRPLFEVIPVTDARSLWDSVHRLTTSFQEKRVELDVAALRQTCKGLRWVPSEQQLADALTKRSRALRDSFREWMSNPVVKLKDSKTPADLLGTSANAAWR
ncbi:unnamed protein product [Symbiodinium sp. CCMP2592]|nr:unnamed protein product [Symbiodinium sp. CCMP2592]